MLNDNCNRVIWTKLFHKRIILTAILLVMSICLSPFAAQAFDIRLGTEAPGSFSYFSGRLLCRIINTQVDDVNCQQVPMVDDVANLTNLQGGSLDISLVNSQVLYDAINKTANFKYLDIGYENLRVLAPLYDVPIALIVRKDAGIASLDDLKGKRINAGNPQSLQDRAVETILQAKGWSRKDFSLVGVLPPIKSQDSKAFCYGTIQAMVYIGQHPDFSLRRLLKTCNGDLLNMDDKDIDGLLTEHPEFWKMDIAAGTYPSHPEKVITFGTRTMVVASVDLDNETVSKIVAALNENRKQLAAAHPALALFSVETAKKSAPGIELHPGAAQYFADH